MFTGSRPAVLLALASACALLSCSDGGTSPRHPQSRIEILPTAAAWLDLGLTDTLRLHARRVNTKGAPLVNDSLVNFHWQSSDTTVLVVDESGLVEIVGLGTATVIARISSTVSILFPHPTDTASATVELTGRPDVIHGGPLRTASTWGHHECVVLMSGQAQCRGQDYAGQLGTGHAIFRQSWTAVTGGIEFLSISTTTSHTCGLSADARAYCWGSNSYGQIGNGRSSSEPNPVPSEVAGDHRWEWLVASGHSQTCGITTEKIPLCFGHNDLGQLGREPTPARDTVVGEFGSGHRMTMIDTDHFFTCGVRTDGTVYCSGTAWGQPYPGIPTPVSSPVNFRSVAVGYWHGCGLDAGGAAYCWGTNDRGQFGTGTVSEFSRTAVPVSGGHVFARIHAFWWTTCGVTTAGETLCWGSNRGGALGRTRIAGSSVPIPLEIGLHAHSIDSYGDAGRACAVDGAGRLVCWGGVTVTAPPSEATRIVDDRALDQH